LSLAPTILAIKTPEHMEENTNNPEPADEEDTQMEYSSDLLYSPNTGAVTKNYL
jgi:hypothetical protein